MYESMALVRLHVLVSSQARTSMCEVSQNTCTKTGAKNFHPKVLAMHVVRDALEHWLCALQGFRMKRLDKNALLPFCFLLECKV